MVRKCRCEAQNTAFRCGLHATRPADELASGGGARMLSTSAFLKEAGTAGGFRKEVPAFAARWVHGRGTPRLTAAFAYNRCGHPAGRGFGGLACRKLQGCWPAVSACRCGGLWKQECRGGICSGSSQPCSRRSAGCRDVTTSCDLSRLPSIAVFCCRVADGHTSWWSLAGSATT